MYYPDLICHWELTTDQAIRYSFKKFELEPRDTEYTGACFDFVEIVDGKHLNDRTIFGPQCGSREPFIIKGNRQKLSIVQLRTV